MSYVPAIALIDQFAALGGRELTLTGGEPLEYKRCSDVIRRGKSHGLRVTLFSMGIVGSIEPALSTLTEMPDEWFLSLHGARAPNHEKLTHVPGSFNSTVEAARRIVAAGVETKVSFVAADGNLPDLVDLARLCAGIGIREIRVLTIVPQGRGLYMKKAPAEDRLFDAIERANLASRVVVRLGEAAKAEFGLQNSCSAVHDELIVNWDGWVSPCHSFEPTGSESMLDNAFSAPLVTVLSESPRLRSCRSLAAQVSTECNQGCLVRRALLEPVGQASIRS